MLAFANALQEDAMNKIFVKYANDSLIRRCIMILNLRPLVYPIAINTRSISNYSCPPSPSLVLPLSSPMLPCVHHRLDQQNFFVVLFCGGQLLAACSRDVLKMCASHLAWTSSLLKTTGFLWKATLQLNS